MNISRPLKMSAKYYDWWVTTLKSCLPEQVNRLFKKYNREVELLIRHHGDSIFLQDNHGRVIETTSTALSSQGDEQDVSGLDIDLGIEDGTEATRFDEIDATNIDLTAHSEVIHHEFNKKQNNHTTGFNLDDIDLTERNDSTIVFNREDKTTRLLGLVSEDDSLVIKDDQGTLLNFNQESSSESDSTVLYYSDRGRIRPVEIKKETKAHQDIDIHLVSDEVIADKNDDCEEFYLAAGLLQKHPGKKSCLYLLPDERVYSLVLNYPVEVLENIENVLRYDLEKHIPLNFQEIRYFYALNILSAQSKVDVEVIVIKSEVYDLLQLAFESESEREIICTTKHFYQHFGTKINILANRKDNQQDSKFSMGNLHIALNVALLAIIFVVPYYLQNQKLNAIQPKTSAEISKAGAIVSTVNQLNAEIQLGKKLSEQIKKDHRMIDLLAQLSEHISTDAWISRFTYKNGELKIKGEAVSATTVSDDLNKTGLFESIKFVSSIVKNPNTKKEAFELSLKVKSDA